MKIIEYAKLYKKVKEYSNGKHWIDLYNLWKLRNLDAELKEARLLREGRASKKAEKSQTVQYS